MLEQPAIAPVKGSLRSKRSTTNLADLRLAPLSTKFDASADKTTSNSRRSTDDQREFSRHHSSYLQGRSAPTTPGILSRSSSRRHLTGGISRRGSLYDDEDDNGTTYEYAGLELRHNRVKDVNAPITKAKSEGTLLVKQPSSNSPQSRRRARHSRYTSSVSGSTTPRAKNRTYPVDDDWLTRAGAATNAVLQEYKGQSWLATRDSTAAIGGATESTDEDDDDDGYEEMAAMSAMTVRGPRKKFPASAPATRRGSQSPVSTRTSIWGSRYGSRATSRRTSRRGSFSGLRTPTAASTGPDNVTSYFDTSTGIGVPDAVEIEADSSADERELARLVQDTSGYGLSGFMDRVINSSLFNVSEDVSESSYDEGEDGPRLLLRKGETEAEARARRAAEAKRRREEKERLVALPTPIDEADATEQADVGWRDAAWLLSVASRALFTDGR